MLPSDAFFFFSFAQKTISILTADFEDLKISDNFLPRHIPCLKNVSVCRLRRKPLSISVFLPFFTATKKVNNVRIHRPRTPWNRISMLLQLKLSYIYKWIKMYPFDLLSIWQGQMTAFLLRPHGIGVFTAWLDDPATRCKTDETAAGLDVAGDGRRSVHYNLDLRWRHERHYAKQVVLMGLKVYLLTTGKITNTKIKGDTTTRTVRVSEMDWRIGQNDQLFISSCKVGCF
jgi:hypothetical protein